MYALGFGFIFYKSSSDTAFPSLPSKHQGCKSCLKAQALEPEDLGLNRKSAIY